MKYTTGCAWESHENPADIMLNKAYVNSFCLLPCMKPKCRQKILTRTSVFVVSDLQLQYLQMSGNISRTLINSEMLLTIITPCSVGTAKIEGPGVLNKILYREAPPRGPTPYHFIYHFWQKRYSLYWQWYPFHMPSLKLCIPLNCCKCTVFEIWTSHKTRKFNSHVMHL